MDSRTALEVLRYDSLLPSKYKRLWSEWEIRIFVLGSLALQVFLVVLAPSRKVRPGRGVRFITWSCYLLADAVANFALGHLADNLSNDNAFPSSPWEGSGAGNSKNHTSTGLQRDYYYPLSHRGGGGGSGQQKGDQGAVFNGDVMAFWAPFLLLHLGGPDAITAFSLEDNELWLRHLLGVFFQLFGCLYVLFRSFPHNSLVAPTLVMLMVGCIKYVERTYSLYLGSAGGFRNALLTNPDPGPMYFKLMDEYQAKLDAGLQPKIEIIRENELKFLNVADVEAADGTPKSQLDDVDTILSAFKFFTIYKRLVVDLVLSFHERKESQQFFQKLKAQEAFRVISVELNFLYDVLYTKAPVIHKYWGLAFRMTCTAGIIASFLMFFFFKKEGFHRMDVWITYALLIGAVALDAVGYVLLSLSEWTLVSLHDTPLRKCLGRWVARSGKKRWSGLVSRLDLVGYCLHEVPQEKRRCLRQCRPRVLEKVAGWICAGEFFEEVTYAYRTPLHDELLTFIFTELNLKSKEAKDLETTKKLIECKGLHVLDTHNLAMEDDDPLWRSVKLEFDESVLIWHIATALCLYQDNKEKNGSTANLQQGLSKQLSEYMMYLLVMQTNLMSAMGGIGLLRYRDTCQEARLFFDTSGEVLIWGDACKMLLSVTTDVAKPSDVKGDRSKSVLFDGCILAKRLMKLKVSAEAPKAGAGAPAEESGALEEMEKKLRWDVIAKVWVELLSYAACHCRGMDHARKLSTGGELLNLVWLLMAQLGLGEQFRTETGEARAKLVFNK
ncbi:hypothetical protein Taro_014861 [Colocasia esculenta]|uniref:DUF4220 domain-containing protein n=1 Tax=Colocasia esculenta TaxID=4460 RepID=A0A843UJ97_COLES|nr:hypothetical protein [Colocasia esculenta]